MEQRSTNASVFRHLDWFTVVIYVCLVVYGVFSIYAASYDFDHASIFSFSEFSGKQVMWIGISFAVGFIILLIETRMIEAYAYPVYLLMILLLIVTIFIAKPINGSKSWIVMGSFSIQPAEFAKFATALALAKLFSGYNFKLTESPGNFLKAIGIIMTPVILIICQKETGSALVFMSLFFVLYREGMTGLLLLAALCAVVIFVVAVKYSETLTMGIPTGEVVVFVLIMALMTGMVAYYCRNGEMARNLLLWYGGTGLLAVVLGLCKVAVNGYVFFLVVLAVGCGYCLLMSLRGRGRNIPMILGAVVLSVAFLFSVNVAFNMLAPHQQQRIRVTLGNIQDLRKDGYNVNQSKIAIGSGGVTGKGFLNGTQTKLKYVPEQHTDFIYCTIGEEQGFLGASAVLVAFLILILRVMALAERQPNAFGRVYGYCVACYFLFHLCINVGMVIGLCPVIGIPLPFFSYGGSSLLGFTILLFVLLRIDASRREYLSY